MFSAISLLVFCFLFFFEALVLATSLSFGNLVSRSCSTYFDKVTTFSLLNISSSSSVSMLLNALAASRDSCSCSSRIYI